MSHRRAGRGLSWAHSLPTSCRAACITPAAPPLALAQGGPERGGGLVPGQGVAHPVDPDAQAGALGGKLRVLSNGPGVPAAQGLQHLPVDGKACAHQLCRQAQSRPGAVEGPVKGGEVQSIAPGHRAGGGVGGHHPGLAHPGPGNKGVVHPGEKVRVRHVVRVEHHKGVVPFGQKLLHGLMEGVALAFHRPQALQDLRPGGRRGGLGEVGAVVWHHVHIPEVRRIVLLQNALHQVPDDRFLVPGGHHHGKAGGWGCPGIGSGPFQGKKGQCRQNRP